MILFYEIFAYTSLQFLIFPNIGKKIRFNSSTLFNLLMIIASLMTVWMSAHRSVTTDFQPQGRYILTILPILTVWMVNGFHKMTKYWNNLKLKPTILSLSILYIVVGMVIILHYVFMNPALV